MSVLAAAFAGALVGGGLVYWLVGQALVRAREQLAEERRSHKRFELMMRANATTHVKTAAVANYRSGYRDATQELCERIQGRRTAGTEDVGGVYVGNVPAPLRRWLDETRARVEEGL